MQFTTVLGQSMHPRADYRAITPEALQKSADKMNEGNYRLWFQGHKCLVTKAWIEEWVAQDDSGR